MGEAMSFKLAPKRHLVGLHMDSEHDVSAPPPNWKRLRAVLGGLCTACILILVPTLLARPILENGTESRGSGGHGVAEGIPIGQSRLRSPTRMRSLRDAPTIENLVASNQHLRAELAAVHAELEAAQAQLSTQVRAMLHTSEEKDQLIESALAAANPPKQEGQGEDGAIPPLTPLEEALEKFHSLVGPKPAQPLPEPTLTPSQLLDKKTKAAIGACLELESATKTSSQELNHAWQRWSTGVREARWRKMVVEKVTWLQSQKEYWAPLQGMDLRDASVAGQHLATLEGEEKAKFTNFLQAYLPNAEWWKPQDPQNLPELQRWRGEAEAAEASLAEAKGSAERALASLEKRLWGQCQMRGAAWNWTQAHQEVLRHRATPDGASPPAVDPAVRTQPGLAAPETSWKQHPRLYPDPAVNATFLLQYFRQPHMIATIVDRLYQCTEGHLGRGQLPGLTTELMVNVDEPEEMQQWHDAWRKTQAGDFVVPVFNHNVHENRGYNNLANMARGELIVLIQDDDIPPENCSWLTKVLAVYHTWPHVGIVGLQTGRLSTEGYVWGTPEAFLRPGKDPHFNRLYDPATGIRMYFASVVDVGPMVVKRDLWVQLGGFSEDYCRAGESCIVADWQFVLRAWLAGYQVVHMYSPSEISWVGGAEGGTHKAGYGFSSRLQNLDINTEAYTQTYMEYSPRLVKEVKRLNGYMRAVPQWE